MTSPFFQLSHKACYLFRIGSLLQNGVDLFLIVADCEGLLFFFMVALLMWSSIGLDEDLVLQEGAQAGDWGLKYANSFHFLVGDIITITL
ncbi:hypothetical protein JHK82_018965 [Glycine max]|uniref:Uncharacterized protein n=2 Tax=Glycine subgen. Soja TaxID=1462606 RepID=K7L2C3_SOYBN|nr:hypothetical protein JHK85_019403 [Glycine max]KHN35754.1 hypothetical protein glysoja_048327 [Glycine soja]KAG5143270.1 hypothetical protein JHK82_018965 [Glycine max]KAH1087294.1 hypothetical protein GYH30_018716 [Glycine max]KRH49699.1 hypothetical protein GLYMA_07G173400v4 [Glycine max]